MLPYGTEVGSVPRFAVDEKTTAAAATTHPRLLCLHDDEDEEVLSCSQPDLPPY